METAKIVRPVLDYARPSLYKPATLGDRYFILGMALAWLVTCGVAAWIIVADVLRVCHG